ncbi:MAG: hypothetical protein H0U73_13865 [Tatlockia sp.]|nr:hypothetical protein [Tatlockia sp.]
MKHLSDIENTIALDKKQLTQFVLNVCGFTLDEAGYNSKELGFYMHVAFRHQAILKSRQWELIVQDALKLKSLDNLWIDSPKTKKLQERITRFSQSIVTEVVEASQDNWAIKLLKTSYFAPLDRARKSSEDAIKKINIKSGQKFEDLQASTIQSDDKTTELFTVLLRANRTYLDSLLGLPFVMEKLCVSLARKRHNGNYQPRKTAHMLAKTLDTINAAMSIEVDSESTRRNFLIEGLKLALKITMPDIPINSELENTISTKVLPFINQVIENSKNLELAKAQVFPKDDKETTAARASLLAAMDVQFYSVQGILQETLLKPVEQFNQAVANAAGFGLAAYHVAIENNAIDRALHVGELFKNFDQMASLCSELDSNLLPSWLNQANGYFQQIKNGVDTIAQVTLNGLGAFYSCVNQLAFFIPESIRYYISHKNTFQQIFNMIDKSATDIPYDKVLAYFSFYELIKQAQLTTHELKEKFFEIYMAEVVKAANKPNVVGFNFKSYELLEKQLDTKEDLNLKLPLAERISQYEQDADFTNSMFEATAAQGFSNPKILGALILIHRLQTLESKFDINNPIAAFDELTKAIEKVSQTPLPELQAINEKFLQPAIQRMYSQYQIERLIPLLEETLDKPDAYTNQFTHELSLIYSKLQEKKDLSADEVDALLDYFDKKPNNQHPEIVNELSSVKNLTTLLPSTTKLPAEKWKTPNERRKLKASQTLENIRPTILTMFDILQRRLTEQKKRISPLFNIELANKKINYINALNGLINKLTRELENPDLQQYSDLQDHFVQLLNGKVNPLDIEQIKERFSLSVSAIPGKLLGFIWNVLPVSPQNTLFYNLLEYSLRDMEALPELVKAEKEYKFCLNNTPIPALMNELSDPLAVANVIPSQEKIMDAIIANLIETSKQSTFAWGVNYLKQLVKSVTYEQLILFLPYPFFAELAVMALQSETLQSRVAPVFNSIMSEYGDLATKELKRIAKDRLYPILGVVVQKTIESCAYSYAINLEKANATERDSFAMFYLQYRELRQQVRSFNNEDAIRFLFPNLLAEVKTDSQQEIIKQINEEFIKLDKILPPDLTLLPINDEIEASNQQLQFFIDHIDLKDSANDKLIKIALVNRLVIMALDTTEQLSNENQINTLQIKAIDTLSKTLDKLNRLSEQSLVENPHIDIGLGDSAVLVPANDTPTEELTQALSGSHKRAIRLQLDRVKTSLAKSKTLVDDELRNLREMKKTDHFLGLSVLAWEYHNDPLPRKVFRFLSKLGAIVGPISSWVTIITLIITTGLSLSNIMTVALGWTGIGFAIGASLGLLLNFAVNIFDNLMEIKTISNGNESFWLRAGKISLIVLHSLGLALAKTLFIDQIANGLTTLFAMKPLEEFRDLLLFWPSKKRVGDEIKNLEILQGQFEKLELLMEMQVNFIENKIDPITGKAYTDQSKEITPLINKLGITMSSIQFILAPEKNSNDARIKLRHYDELLESFATNFANLNDELIRMEQLRTVQLSTQMRVEPITVAENDLKVDAIIPQNTNQAKPVRVMLDAYREKLQDQPGYLSRFWNLFRANPNLVVESEKVIESNEVLPSSDHMVSEAQKDNLVNPLTVSSFYLVESTSLVDSILDGISAATPEKEEKKELSNTLSEEKKDSIISKKSKQNGGLYNFFAKDEGAKEETTAINSLINH